jgi:hypothetical protein
MSHLCGKLKSYKGRTDTVPLEVLTAVSMKSTNFWSVMLLIRRDCDLSEEHIAFSRVEEYTKKDTNRNSQ